MLARGGKYQERASFPNNTLFINLHFNICVQLYLILHKLWQKLQGSPKIKLLYFSTFSKNSFARMFSRLTWMIPESLTQFGSAILEIINNKALDWPPLSNPIPKARFVRLLDTHLINFLSYSKWNQNSFCFLILLWHPPPAPTVFLMSILIVM